MEAAFKGKEEESYHGHRGSGVSISPADEGMKSGEGALPLSVRNLLILFPQESNSDDLGEQG